MGLLRTERTELIGEIRRVSAGGAIWDGLHDVGTREMWAEAGGALWRPLEVKQWTLYLMEAKKKAVKFANDKRHDVISTKKQLMQNGLKEPKF